MNKRRSTFFAGLLLSLAFIVTACSSPAPTGPAETSTPLQPSLTPAAAPTVELSPTTNSESTATSVAPATTAPTAVIPSATSPSATATSAPTVAPTSAPAAGSSATPSTGAACTNRAVFVADVTVADNTRLAPNQAFNKIWRLRNTGTCTWTNGYTFAFVTGQAMTSATSMSAPDTAPGATVDIVVPMTAPAALGSYRGFWELKTPNGSGFGRVWVLIRVVNTGAAGASATPTPGGTATP